MRYTDAVTNEHFERDEVVFMQGDFGDKLYFIVRGEVEILIDGVVARTLHAGDSFGEIALVSNNPRAATVRAVSPLDVVSVSRSAFERLLAHLPGMHDTMHQIIARHLGDQGPRQS